MTTAPPSTSKKMRRGEFAGKCEGCEEVMDQQLLYEHAKMCKGMCQCPTCQEPVSVAVFVEHYDKCKPGNKICFICLEFFFTTPGARMASFEKHVETCLRKVTKLVKAEESQSQSGGIAVSKSSKKAGGGGSSSSSKVPKMKSPESTGKSPVSATAGSPSLHNLQRGSNEEKVGSKRARPEEDEDEEQVDDHDAHATPKNKGKGRLTLTPKSGNGKQRAKESPCDDGHLAGFKMDNDSSGSETESDDGNTSKTASSVCSSQDTSRFLNGFMPVRRGRKPGTGFGTPKTQRNSQGGSSSKGGGCKSEGSGSVPVVRGVDRYACTADEEAELNSSGNLSAEQWRKCLDMAFQKGWDGRDGLERKLVGGRSKVGDRETMYGGLYSNAVEEVIKVANITKDDRFFDVGSGIGQVVMQVALRTGAKSLGVELDEKRHQEAVKLRGYLHDQLLEEEHTQAAGALIDDSKVTLMHGCFTSTEESIIGSNVIFFNNAGGHFHGCKAGENPQKGEQKFENKLIEILKKCETGTKLITVEDMVNLPRGWKTKVVLDNRSTPLEVSTMKIIDCSEENIGEQACSWRVDLTLYMYTIQPEWMCQKCTLRSSDYPDESRCRMCNSRPFSDRPKSQTQPLK